MPTPIDAPVNAMAYNEKGDAIPFRCCQCGSAACYYSGRDWYCGADWLALQTEPR